MKKLEECDFITASKLLNCDLSSIKAVAEIESPGSGFQADGQPKILFERHYFHRLTKGKYDKSHPNISNKNWGGYGLSSQQHERLKLASTLDRNSALQSASWGKFQIMGANYEKAGFKTIQSFINAMYDSETAHLMAFVDFIKYDKALWSALRNKDWRTFARIYNGPDYEKNKYHLKLRDAEIKYRK